MAKLNVAQVKVRAGKEVTHEGALAGPQSPEMRLRRTVMACLLWENTFYEDGKSVAERITQGVAAVKPEHAAAIAIEARNQMKLRHVPLLVARTMAQLPQHKALVGDVLANIIQRPDELAEFLAIYWKDADRSALTKDAARSQGNRQPLAKQVKKGLAKAFTKFNEYQLAKYNRDGAVKLKDVLFLTHPTPRDEEQAALWKRLIAGTLASAETWENRLSRGEDKAETFIALMQQNKLGALAFLRNLRNMFEAKVPKAAVADYAASIKVERVLPFRFISAARAVPAWESVIEPLMLKCMQAQPKFGGPTAILIDHSSSMQSAVSEKSEITRFDAAAALAILLREVCDDLRTFTFSDEMHEIPARRGFELRDAIMAKSKPAGTLLGSAVRKVYQQYPECQRILVVTDEQSYDRPPHPQGKGYILNVGAYAPSIAYGPWITINGWSEAVIAYIRAVEGVGEVQPETEALEEAQG